ncbi:MAG: FAD:protein FMN transferase [Clostridia bacterium]|nr:FAD:protein FMN transferase [Clostridia bacterium]
MRRKNLLGKCSKILVAILLVSLVIIPQTGCGDKEPVSGTDEYLDTECTISVYGMKEKEAQEIITGAFGEIARYESLLSKTVEGSDVDRVNMAGGKTVKVSEDTAKAINMGLETGKLSGGDFDITVGRLTDLWDFKAAEPEVPSEEDIDEAVTTVEYGKVGVKGNEVTLEDSEAKLELGGIAKGYIADRITEYLEDNGVSSAIINLGGNVVTIGSKDDGSDFVIGIERPYSDRTEMVGSVSVSDKTVVTSGVYERMFEKDGVLYHHIIDPQTGYPAETDLEAVTIVADKGYSCFCDGLSTACLMAGSDGAMELVKKVQKDNPDMHIEASFIDENDNLTMTDGMVINPVE